MSFAKDGGGDWWECGAPNGDDWGKDDDDDTGWRQPQTAWSDEPQYTQWQQATPPLQDTWSKAYGKGWTEGNAHGYSEGFREGFDTGSKRKVTLVGKKAERTDERHDESEEESASGSQRSKRKKPKGKKNKNAWKAFHEKYTEAKGDEGEDVYMVKLGQNSYELYPEEIQEQLRANAAAIAEDSCSKSLVYDMTDGWLFHVRLFSAEELPQWEDKLSGFLAKDDDQCVGAQWDANKAKEDPPTVFEKGVQYRPILVKTIT